MLVVAGCCSNKPWTTLKASAVTPEGAAALSWQCLYSIPGDAVGMVPRYAASLGKPLGRGRLGVALPFLVYLHAVARSSALETAAGHGACRGRLGWSSASGPFTAGGFDSLAGVNQDLAAFNSRVADTT